MKFRGAIVGLIVAASGLLGCDGETTARIDPLPEAVVTVTPTTLALSVGQTSTANAVVANDSASRGVTWSSSNLGVATVVANTGQITGVSPGTATITATSNRTPTKSASLSVVVAPVVTTPLIAIVPGTFTVNVGQKQTLLMTVPDTAGITWTSSANAVATVSTAGVVTGVSPGTAVITATLKSDPSKSATSVATVIGVATIGGITISPASLNLLVGQKQTLTATGDTTGYTWSSSASGVAAVSATGEVTAVGAGTAIITATSKRDPTATATAVVTVGAAITVSVTPTTLNLTVGQKQTLTAAGDTAGFTWASSSTSVATVAATGEVTGVAPGAATITVTSKRDTTKKATASVVVSIAVNLTPTAFNLPIGQKQTLVATGDTAGYNWSSSVPTIASVNSNGQVTAVSGGTAVITAASKRDTTKKATSTVTVTFPPAVTLPIVGAGVVNERYTAEIAVKGNFAYTTTWSTRAFNNVNSGGNVVKIWNVAGATPILVDSLKITSANTTSDVQVSPDGSLLVVSTEQGTGSIVIYSLANPAAPTLISRYSTAETLRGVHTVKLSVINGKLYGFLQIDPGSGLKAQEVIVDMSNPANVQQVFAQVMGTPYVHDVLVRDGLLFAANWNDGMTIFDIGGGGRGGTPSNPVVISTIKTTTGQIHNIAWFQDPLNGNKKYVFLGEEGPTSGPIGAGGITSGDIHVVDITDITAPREVAVYTLGAQMGTHNFYIDEPSGILYAAYYNGGVRAIDVRGDLSTCTTAQRATLVTSITGAPLCDLRLVGREAGTSLTTGGYFVWGVMMQGNRLYASDMGKGLVILDATALKR